VRFEPSDEYAGTENETTRREREVFKSCDTRESIERASKLHHAQNTITESTVQIYTEYTFDVIIEQLQRRRRIADL
jgi:hypothetical protein